MDWNITVTFYEALHYVDAYFMRKLGSKPNTHEARDRFVDATLKPIVGAYHQLKSRSRNARYETPFSQLKDPAERKRARELREKHLEEIKAYLRRLAPELGIP